MGSKYSFAILFLLVFLTTAAFANPSIDPFKTTASFLVVLSTLGLEAFITAMILLFFSMSPGSVFVAVFLGNLGMFFTIFLPLLYARPNLLVSEILIVVIEGSFIKFISRFERFQLDTFTRLRWSTAFFVATVGNLLSYYVGTTVHFHLF